MQLATLPYDDMAASREALTLYAQLLGSVKEALTPAVQGEDEITLALTARGLSTGLLLGGVEVRLDLLEQKLRVLRSSGRLQTLDLPGSTVALLYSGLGQALRDLGAEVSLRGEPFPDSGAGSTPFAEDVSHGGEDYRPGDARAIFGVWTGIYGVLRRFAADVAGVDAAAVVSVRDLRLRVCLPDGVSGGPAARRYCGGLSLGDDSRPEAHFFGERSGAAEASPRELRPSGAQWRVPGSSAVLMYRAVAPRDDWPEAIGSFFESSYKAEGDASDR